MNQEIDPQKYELVSQVRSGSFGTYNITKNSSSNQLFYTKISFNKITFESEKFDRKSRSSKEYAERLFVFVNEVEIHSQLFHPGIILYVGFSKTDFNGDPYPMIFTDNPACGTLRDVLYKKNSKIGSLSKPQKYICVYGIAAAMEFLHKKKIIHFNLSTDSILLDEQKLPKISEFSSSQQGTINRDSVKFDAILYTAPELFEEEPVDEKVDVYSFGIILNEIYSKKQPYDGIKNPFLLQSKIANNFRPEIASRTSASQFKSLITRCWHKDPKERPSFTEILEILRSDKFLNNKKLEVKKDDFFSYVEFINSAEKAYESNPNQNINIFDFIKDKSKSEIKVVEGLNSENKKRISRRFTLHSSKSKTYVGDYKIEKKKIPLIDDNSESTNNVDESSKKSETESTDNSGQSNKKHKSHHSKKRHKKDDSTEKSDSYEKMDKKYDKVESSYKSDDITQTIPKSMEKEQISLFPSTLFIKLTPKCQAIVTSADKNDNSSLKKLTSSLIEGSNDFPQNIGIAVSYLQKGIKNGNTSSMLQLGELYQKGEYLPRNYIKSVSLYRQILKQTGSKSDKLTAEANLYSIQLSNDPETKPLFNDQIDYQKVSKTFKESADKGNVDSMVLYAKHCMCERGQSSRNLKETVKYLKMAIKDGSGEAMAVYGQILEHGYGIEEVNKKEANEMYMKSYEKNDKKGEAYFGFSKICGGGKEKEKDGLKMIIDSKEDENPAGINAYGLVIFNGLCDFIADEERGAFYIKMAADCGYANAMYNLARCLEKGKGVSKDVNEAVIYYKKSLNEGCLIASFYLGNLLTKGDKEANLDADAEEGKKYLKIASDYKITISDQNKLNLLV